VHVVRVAGLVLQAAIGLGADDLLGFVGNAPADQAVGVEDRNVLEQTARGQAVDAHVARVAAGRKGVVLIKLAGSHFVLAHLGGGVRDGRRGRGSGRCGSGGFVVAGGDPNGQPGQGSGVDEPAASDANGCCAQVFFLVTHGELPL